VGHSGRKTEDVLRDLLTERDRLVKDYGRVEPTGEPFPWTSFFPGGAGVYRGENSQGGPLPEWFPEKPVMFVAHNFGDYAWYKNVKCADFRSLFWEAFWIYLKVLKIDRQDIFLTNALMGLKVGGGADGYMEGRGPKFNRQCLDFFYRQVEIVDPRRVVVMGQEAACALYVFEPKDLVRHPRSFCRSSDREERIAKALGPLLRTQTEMGAGASQPNLN
jgi:hypothetical protein